MSNALQIDKVRLSIGDSYLNGVTSSSISSSTNYVRGSLLNLGEPKSTFNGDQLISMSLEKFATAEDFTTYLKGYILLSNREDVTLVIDSYGDSATGIKLEQCWFDEFTFNIGYRRHATCSWESKTRVITNFEDEIAPSSPADSTFLTADCFSFTSNNSGLEYTENVSINLSTKKKLVSSIWSEEQIWKSYPVVTITVTVPDAYRVSMFESTTFDTADFMIEVYTDSSKTTKIMELDLSECTLESYSDGFSEASKQAVNYTFTKIISSNQISFFA